MLCKVAVDAMPSTPSMQCLDEQGALCFRGHEITTNMILNGTGFLRVSISEYYLHAFNGITWVKKGLTEVRLAKAGTADSFAPLTKVFVSVAVRVSL